MIPAGESILAVADKLKALLAPLVTALGYEFVGLEFLQGGGRVLRVYIDDPEAGVGLEDCETVSREVSALLDVEDPISGDYTLEVSSPGLDRPLFEAADYSRFDGEAVRVTTLAPVAGQRKFRGRLAGVTTEHVRLAVDDREVEIELNNIAKARLDPQW